MRDRRVRQARAPKPPIPNPPPDNERSPFEMDRPDNGAAPAPGGATPGDGTPATRTNPPPPATDTSPFDVPETKPAGAGAMPDGRPQASRSTRSTSPALPDSSTPELAPPGDAPAAPPRTSWNRRSNQARETDPGPILNTPDATLPAVEESSTAANSNTNAAGDAVASNSAADRPGNGPDSHSTGPPARSHQLALRGSGSQLAAEVTLLDLAIRNRCLRKEPRSQRTHDSRLRRHAGGSDRGIRSQCIRRSSISTHWAPSQSPRFLR